MAIEEIDAIALSFGLFVCLYGIGSYRLKEQFCLNEAPLAFLLGVFLGPYGIGQLTQWGASREDPDSADALILGMSRIVIGIQLVLCGIQLPQAYPWHEVRSLGTLVGPVMVSQWLVTAWLIQLCIPNVPFLVALVLSGASTPTDPVLANALTKGSFSEEYVPARVRNLISAESGCNDGLASPLVYLAIRLIGSSSTGEALSKWIVNDFLFNIGGAVALGLLIGVLANRVLRMGCRRESVDKESFLLFGPMVGLVCIGMAGAIGCDDLLTAFVAGNALTWDDWYRKETETDEVQNVLDFLLNSMFFAFAGASVPFWMFNLPETVGTTPLRLLALGVLVIVFRRLPGVLAFYRGMPAVKDLGEALFIGYFGPIGAGAIFYAAEILHEFPKEVSGTGGDGDRVRQLTRPVVSTLILASLIAHTMAVPLIKFIFEKRGVESIRLTDYESDSDEAEDEYEEGEGPAPENVQGDRPYRDDEEGEGGDDDRDVEMAQPPSSSHKPTLQHLHRRSTTGGGGRDDGRGDDGEEDQQGDHSWRHSSGHKLGPHLKSEHLSHHQAIQRGRGRGASVRSREG